MSQEKNSVVDFTLQWPNMRRAVNTDAFVLDKQEAEFIRPEFPTFFDERAINISNCVIIPGFWAALTIDEHQDKSRQMILYNFFVKRLLRRRVLVIDDIYGDKYTFNAVYGNGLVSLYKVHNATDYSTNWSGFYVPKMLKSARRY